MPDKDDRSPGYSMFGLDDRGEQKSAAQETGQPAPGSGGQYGYAQGPAAPAGVKMLPWLVGALLALSIVNLVLVLSSRSETREVLSKQSDQLNLLTRRMDSSDERYAQLKGQFQVTSEKLGLTQQELSRARTLASDIQKQQKAAVQQLNTAIAQKASADELNKLQADSTAKYGALSGDIAGTKKELSDALAGTKGELSGAIARTHDELVELAHRSDRDYFELKVNRKGARQKIGRVMVELARTNPKKNQFTVNLFFDDKRAERKDKAIDEPVYFYVQGASSPLELVINSVTKNSIQGYLSTPKGLFPDTPNVLTARPGS